MSKSGEEDDECFYDSLDRIASSSQTTSSCSSSDNEESSANSPNHDSPFPVPKFPMRVVKYDIWVSEPLSVQDRRTRLLREMGLSSDPSLTRVKPIFRSDYREKSNGEFGRSASSGRLRNQRQSPGESSSMSRSKSDSAAEIDSRNDHSSVSSRILSFDSSSSSLSVNNYRHNHTHNDKHNKFVIELPSSRSYGSPAASPNKPPIGRNCRKLDELGANSVSSGPNWMSNSPPVVENRKVDEDLGHNGLDKKSEQACTIKNLDNGEEFVVKEFREDGMWNKLKEVGTGRQLTMEEFDMTVGHSPIVQELMRRQSVEEGNKDNVDSNANGNGPKLKKKSSWFKSIKNVAGSVTGQKERRSSDERDTSSEKGGRRSSSATDDSQDTSFHGPERVRVRHYGKSCKELTALYKTQEIQAHNGSIWSIKFSLDGRYLASAGEDCFIHVWQVLESSERKGDLLIDKREDMNLNLLFMPNGSPEASSLSPNLDNHLERKRRGRPSLSRKSVSLDHVIVPETIFALSEKPICSFQGHLDDVLDLSWSKSQHLLSSSMDKTVRLWHLSSRSCLKIFSHSDYVTCIHFNPVDDGYFISGSLDGKVRIWSIPDRQVVDWNDLHEMVTAACYTPDGQSALVGSYKGSCHLYNTSENKLQQKSKINLQNKKKKSHHKKITGFQFAPGSLSEVLVTSADSRIRVIDGVDMVHKFKGFRNTNSQIAASFTSNGKYVVCASEDSHVYVWKHEHDPRPSKSKGVVTVTSSYEHSHCQDVSVAIPWPGISEGLGPQDPYLGGPDGLHSLLDDPPTTNHPPTPVENAGGEVDSARTSSSIHETISSATNSYFFDRISATWPEEKLLRATKSHSPRVSMDLCNGVIQNRSAWGLVIVTAGLRGEIRTFQNFGLPVRI